MRYRLAGREVTVLAGSTLHVDERFRKSGLGLKLPEWRHRVSPSHVAMGSGLSQLALPVHRLSEHRVFEFPRRIALWRSRVVLERWFGNLALKVACLPVDFLLALWALALKAVVAWKLRGLEFVEVTSRDAAALEAVATLALADPAAAAELHDARWFKWMLEQSFAGDGGARLWQLRRGGALVGFGMVRRRFYPTASHRGFRNLRLVSALEWQLVAGEARRLKWVLVGLGLLTRRDADAYEVVCTEAGLDGGLGHCGFRQVGNGNFVIKAGDEADADLCSAVREEQSWRFRPAMGDNGF